MFHTLFRSVLARKYRKASEAFPPNPWARVLASLGVTFPRQSQSQTPQAIPSGDHDQHGRPLDPQSRPAGRRRTISGTGGRRRENCQASPRTRPAASWRPSPAAYERAAAESAPNVAVGALPTSGPDSLLIESQSVWPAYPGYLKWPPRRRRRRSIRRRDPGRQEIQGRDARVERTPGPPAATPPIGAVRFARAIRTAGRSLRRPAWRGTSECPCPPDTEAACSFPVVGPARHCGAGRQSSLLLQTCAGKA